MTTLTEPPLIDGPSIGVDDMPALDQPDERVCEVTDCPSHGRAWWAATFDCGPCGTWLALICEPCRSEARQYPFECDDCGDAALLMHAEPLR